MMLAKLPSIKTAFWLLLFVVAVFVVIISYTTLDASVSFTVWGHFNASRSPISSFSNLWRNLDRTAVTSQTPTFQTNLQNLSRNSLQYLHSKNVSIDQNQLPTNPQQNRFTLNPTSEERKQQRSKPRKKQKPVSAQEYRDKKFKNALQWTGAPLERGQPQWQMLDTNFSAFVYSAHFDDVDLPPLIRIVSVIEEIFTHINVTCRFYDSRDGPVTHSVSGTLYPYRNRNGRRYIGAFADCPLSRNRTSLPFAVSVNKGNESLQNNYMIVHNSHSKLWIRKHRYPDNLGDNFQSDISNDSTAKDNNKTDDPSKKNRRQEDQWRWNVTRCFPAFQRNFSNHVLLAEMVAASKVLGVQHFVFYVESASPSVLAMLQVLENEGVAEVHPWNLHLFGKDLFYMSQFSAIQECLYRHLWSSRFLLFGDVDELFVPRKHPTLMPVLQGVFEKKPDCGTFLFRNTFYNLHLPTQIPPPSIDPSGFAGKQHLTMLTHVSREGVLPSGTRSKPSVDPHKVFVGSVHIVHRLRTGFRSCSMDPNLALLHHYRHWAMYPKYQKEDPYLWQFAGDILQEIKIYLNKFEDTVFKPYP